MSNYESNKKSILKYQKENVVYVRIGMKPEQKERWQYYAEHVAGMPLGTLIKNLMENEMNKHD